jgi:hypothetical protein
VAVNPDTELARIARREDWQVLHLDRLGRRLKGAVGLSAAALAGGIGSVVLVRRLRPRRRLPTPSRPGGSRRPAWP